MRGISISVSEVIEAIVIVILSLFIAFYVGAELAINSAEPEVIEDGVVVEYFGFSSHLYE